MKKIWILVFLVFVVLLSSNVSASWWNSSFHKCQNITISSPVGDYQYKLILNTTNFNYSYANNDGSDVRIVNSSCGNGGVEVQYWIEDWNESGSSVVWFRGDNSSTTVYSIYYNYTDAEAKSNGTNTFELYDVSGIVGFWHMNETSWSGTTEDVKDETGVNNGTAHGGANTTTNGKFKRGGSFDGDNDYVDCGNDESLNVTNAITIEAWVKSGSRDKYILAKDSPDIEVLRPSGNGSETNLPGQYTASSYHWDKVDEVTADDDSTYVRGGVVSATYYNRDLYTLTNHTGSGTINNVTVHFRAIGWTSRTIAATIRTHSTTYDGTNQLMTTSWADYSEEWATNPNTGSSWTWEEIDALEVGVLVQQSGYGEGTYQKVTQVYVEVDYTPPKSDVPYALSTVNGGQFLIRNNSVNYTVNSSTNINDNNWHHIVGTYNGSIMKIYIDGVLEGNNTDFSGNLPTNNGNVRIGADYQTTPANFFNGTIDEVKVYNRTLDSSEISAMYNNYMEKMGSYYNVRKYTFPEPTTALGGEEEYPTISPILLNTTTDKSTYNEGDTVYFISYVNDTNGDYVKLLIDNDTDFTDCDYSTTSGCIAFSSPLQTTGSPQQLNATLTASQNTTWYAKVCDDGGLCDQTNSTDDNATGNFSVNHVPNKPSSTNYPPDEGTNIELNPILNVTVTDPDGDTMNVSFYEYYTGEEWTMFHNFLNHTGYTTNHGVDNISSTEVKTFTTGYFVRSSPAVANGYVYVGSYDNKVYQLNASNISQKIAEFTTVDAVYSSPAVANGYVYVGSYDNKVYQLNASNISQKIAEYTTGNYVYSSPAVANGYIYIGGTNYIYQLNASNISQKIAEYVTGSWIESSPAVANGYVYVGGNDGKVYQLNASNISQKIAEYTTGDYVDSSPAVANGYVYVGSNDNKLYQLNASNISQKIAEYVTGSWIESSPAVANGYVYVGSRDDKLYQFGIGSAFIGTANNIQNGSDATYQWNNLQKGTTYHWLVHVSDGQSYTLSPIWSFTVSSPEVIDITVHEVPILFGNADPGTVNQSAQSGNGYPMIVTIEPTTTVNTNLTVKGLDNFSSGSNYFNIGNLTYSNSSTTGNGIPMTSSYPEPPFDNWLNIPEPSGTEINRSIYFWISVPTDQKPGTYTTTVYIKVYKN